MTAPPVAVGPDIGTAGDGARGTEAGDVRLRWGATISGAFLVTLVRPASWAFGLVAFLAGGGLIVVAWPILVLPTPTGLQNALGTPISSLVFGAPSEAMVWMLVGRSSEVAPTKWSRKPGPMSVPNADSPTRSI